MENGREYFLRERAKRRHAVGRRRYVRSLHKEGHTYKEIGKLMGITGAQANALARQHTVKSFYGGVLDRKSVKRPDGLDVYKEFKAHYDEVMQKDT